MASRIFKKLRELLDVTPPGTTGSYLVNYNNTAKTFAFSAYTAPSVPVTSVATRTGDVVLDASDIGGLAPSATVDTTDAANISSGVLDPARIPILNSQKTVVSSGGIADLTLLQQNEIDEGTTVTTTDGRRWVYGGVGNKDDEARYIVLADITPEWSVIANKPTFVASATTDTTNANNISSGTLAVARGGTGLGTYTVGDLVYASGTTTLSKLADVAAGRVLISGGVGAAPAWSASPTFYDSTPTTGTTQVTVRMGAGDGSGSAIFQVVNATNTSNFFTIFGNGTVSTAILASSGNIWGARDDSNGFKVYSGGQYSFTSGSIGSAIDTALVRSSASAIKITNGSTGDGNLVCGVVTANTGVVTPSLHTGNNVTLDVQSGTIYTGTASNNALTFGSGTENRRTAGTQVAVANLPIWNQTGGSAVNIDSLINRTETSVGSGAQVFARWQVGGVTKVDFSTIGNMTLGSGGSSGSGDVNYIYLNNSSGQNPTIKWNTVSGLQGLRFISNATEVARFQDNGFCYFSGLGIFGGLNIGNNYIQRGVGYRFSVGSGAANDGFQFDGVTTAAPYLQFFGKSSTTNSTEIAYFDVGWVDSTHATRKGFVDLCASDATSKRSGIRIESNGSEALIAIGGGTQFKSILSATAVIDFGPIDPGNLEDQTIIVTGAAVGDSVFLGAPTSVPAGLTWNWFISAANTVTIRMQNWSAFSVNPPSATWRATVVKF
jgi:hypothetical protein